MRLDEVILSIGDDCAALRTRPSDAIVTTVTCLKHPWSVRLYDPKMMRFVKGAEERRVLRQIRANVGQAQQAIVHAAMADL